MALDSTPESNDLCLRQSQSIVDTARASVSVPASVNGYPLIPGADVVGAIGTSRTVDVYTYVDTSGQTPPGTLPTPIGGCAIACSYVSLAKPDVASGTSPGTKGLWTLLETFWLPYCWVISTDADTVFGL